MSFLGNQAHFSVAHKAHFEMLCNSKSGLAHETTPKGAKKVEAEFRRKASKLSHEEFVLFQMAGAVNLAQ